MTLQEQNNLKTGDLFYFPVVGPMRWTCEDGVMHGERSCHAATAYFVRWVYLQDADGKRKKCARCRAPRTGYSVVCGALQNLPLSSIPAKICFFRLDELKAYVKKAAEAEQKAMQEYADRQAEKIKEQLERMRKS